MNEHRPEREVKVLKAKDRVIIPSREDAILKLFHDIESEIGRLSKLLNEARAEFLKVSVE